MSGSGKHTVFKVFEDLGYFCVDNLPTPLIPRLIQMTAVSGGEIEKLAMVVDIRLRESVAGFKELFRQLKQSTFLTSILFVDASDEVLSRRYSETRRVHPLAGSQSLLHALRAERRKLASIRALADLVIDTSEFSVHDLRKLIYENFEQRDDEDPLRVSLLSFGYKYGIPFNSDLVFDVRFLPNPNFVRRLKAKTGEDRAVIQFMRGHADTRKILEKIQDLLEYLLPRYAQEGKAYLTIAIGCTGGRHRSVMVTNDLKKRLEKKQVTVNLIHRDLRRE